MFPLRIAGMANGHQAAASTTLTLRRRCCTCTYSIDKHKTRHRRCSAFCLPIVRLCWRRYPRLISKLRILLFSGDVDECVPYNGAEQWTRGFGYAEVRRSSLISIIVIIFMLLILTCANCFLVVSYTHSLVYTV